MPSNDRCINVPTFGARYRTEISSLTFSFCVSLNDEGTSVFFFGEACAANTRGLSGKTLRTADSSKCEDRTVILARRYWSFGVELVSFFTSLL